MSDLLLTRFDAALLALDRHAQRRRQHIPTLSVVVGAGDAPARFVRHWARLSELNLCETCSVQLPELASQWFARLVAARSLPAAACAWLSDRTGRRTAHAWRSLRSRSPHEREMFLDRFLGAAGDSPAESVCRAVIEHDCEQGSTTAGLWERLLVACRNDVAALFSGAATIVGRGGAPALFVNLPAEAGLDAFDAACRSLTALTSLSPRLIALVSVCSELVQQYLAQAPESHAVALVREGMVSAAWDDEASEASADQGESPRPERVDERRVNAQDDPARSRAERYLFERLQSHPETAGLFELNGLVEAPGAWSGKLEVDLVARGVQVAVEIDGYFHFNDLEAYRRDRRKDVLLQQAEYFVVRCLADDVVSGLEQIVETITAAVRRHRARRQNKEETP